MKYNIDPEFADFLALLPDATITNIQEARASTDEFFASVNTNIDKSGLVIKELDIPGLNGAPAITIRVYSPQQKAATVPGLLSIHGGGFMTGSLNSEESGSVNYAKNLGVVVVAVDYRLAPEDPFPAGLEDCYAALCWMHDNAAELGIDTERVGIAGGSAGGGLSAGLALMARDKKGPAICFQGLMIPELDDRLDTFSMRNFTDTPMWHRANAQLSWKSYLGGQYTSGGDNVPYWASPSRATADELRDLPPAYISTMEFDPLRDEGIEYAMKLMQAGVPVELHHFPGTFHGSSMIQDAAVSQRDSQGFTEALRRGLRVDQ